MNTQTIILDTTSKLYDQLAEKERDKENFQSFELDEKELKLFLKNQKELLLEFIEAKLSHREFPFERCKQFYQEIDVPYVFINGHISLLKTELIKNILDTNLDKTVLLEVETIFDEMKNLIAQTFFKKEISKKLKQIKHSKFDKFPLYAANRAWADKILTTLLHEDYRSFPHEKADECHFSQILQHLSSLMVCMDAKVCNRLEVIHNTLHETSELLYRAAIAKEFSQALYLFKEFNAYLQKFYSLLKDLYYITFSDLESSFFKLIEMLEYGDKNITLTTIDIQNLKQLNIKYGESKVDEFLKEVEEFLQNKVSEDPLNLLVVRAISSNFYICALDKDAKSFSAWLMYLKEELKNYIHKSFSNHKIELNIASCKLDKKVKYQKNELIRILLHLKEISKEHQGFYFAHTQEEKQQIREWLKQHYYNLQYVEEKLDAKMVDVMLQPIYKDGGKEIFAYEALARFKDNNRLIPAGVFIDTVYQIGRISDLDRLVLDAILEKKEWIVSTGKKLFINTSPTSLNDPTYLDALEQFMNIYGTENLLIEITEQQAVKSFEKLEMIHKKYGIKFAIDDFGSGYSSLKMVAEMISKGLIDVLKIDGSLIMHLDQEDESQKIVKIITKMCQVFGIYSLAEFVENKESVSLLNNIGTQLLQGYHLSKPLHIEELIILK